MTFYLLIAAITCLTVLSFVAVYYLNKVRLMNKEQQTVEQQQQAAWTKKRDELINDIRFIANAMTQKQCDITEGCLRLSVLMERLDSDLKEKLEFYGIHKVYEQAQNMPTHEAYTALPKKQQFKLDRERQKLESEYEGKVLEEAMSILTYSFEIAHPH